MTKRIVIATPHHRFDLLQERLASHEAIEILRIRDRDALTAEALRAFDPAYVFFPHWSWKIPREIHEEFECVIFHMTDLPFGRGGSPLQNLIVRGLEETRLSALRCVEEMDAGPIYLKRPLSLLGAAEEILIRAGEIIADMILTISLDAPVPVPQSGEVVSFDRRKPADGSLLKAGSLRATFDLIRMLDAEGYPNAFADVGPFRLEFDRASLHPDMVVADVRITMRKEPS